MARKEDQLAQQVANYLNLQFPKVVYHFDSGSGSRTSIGMAIRNKRLNKHSGWPDLFLAEPKKADLFCKTNNAHGLFIELKVETPFLKDGKTLKASEHLRNQFLLHEVLRSKGYEVHFGVGFEHCKFLIDQYLQK